MTEDQIPKNGAIVTEPKPHEDYTIGRSSIPFDWVKGWKAPFTTVIKDQQITSACGAFALSTLKEIQNADGVVKSTKFIYAPTHAQGGGTSIYALGSHAINKGACSELLCNSYPTTEQNLSSTLGITQKALNDGLKDLSSAYAQIMTVGDIESIAEAFRDHNGGIIGIFGKNNGTWLTENPLPPLKTDTDKFAHWLAVGEIGMYKGKRAVKAYESWGINVGNGGFQWFTEDFFTSGNIWCAWTITENPIIPVFRYTFTKPIVYGETSSEVTALQKALVRLGFLVMPVGVAFGYYGDKTRIAVYNFQVAKQVAVLTELNALQGKVVGPATRKALNLCLN